MSTEATYFATAVVVGVGATLFMDVCALLLNRTFSVPVANYCLVGRWLRYMPEGVFMHASSAAAPRKPAECVVGWAAHYVLGAVYALVLVAIVSGSWLAQPTFVPAILFGVVTVLVPYLIMQPAFGLGVAASKTPHPGQARLRSLMAHTAFGLGLYVSAVCASRVLGVHA